MYFGVASRGPFSQPSVYLDLQQEWIYFNFWPAPINDGVSQGSHPAHTTFKIQFS